MSRLGIDIGSTNSCAAVDDGRVRMIELTQGGAVTMPSIVCIADGEAFVGSEAMDKADQFPDFDFRNFKRRMAEVYNHDEDSDFQTCAGPGGYNNYRGPEGYSYSPIELYSYLLRSIIRSAEKFLAPDDTVTGAVICIPAPFTPEQIAAVKEAALLAGLSEDDITIIEEPIAAAMAAGVDVRKNQMLAVVDFGGGTVDLSLVQAGGGRIQVIGKNGIGDLGGVDFDRRIAEYVINLWRTEYGPEPTLGNAAMARIMAEAERVKKRLSDKDRTEFRVEKISRTPGGVSLNMIYPVTRPIFEELTRDLRDRVIEACKVLVADVRRSDPNFSIRDLHVVLPVGGMTRVPSIRQMIEDFFGKAPRKDENPEQVVAQGAAIKAAILDGRRPDISVADITNFDIAIETVNNVPAIVVPRNTAYPLEKLLKLRNSVDDQTELSVRLLYATKPRAQDCSVLHAEDIAIEPGPAETAQVEMLLKVDKDGHPTLIRAA